MHEGHMVPASRSGGRAAGIPWNTLQRFMAESMPLAAVAHSIHVEALADPRLQADPQFQRFSMIELNELHHQVAALGSLLRLQMGDSAAMASLGMNLAGFLQNRQAALEVASRFPPEVAGHPAVQAVMSLTQQSNQQVAANWPALQQTMAATGGPAPGPMMVRPQH